MTCVLNSQKVFFALGLCLETLVSAPSWAATTPAGADEKAFFTALERPPIKPRQKLGAWFVSAESLLWRSALEALSDKSADKLATADDCQMAMWAAARNEGLRESLNRAFIPLLDTLMIGGLAPALSAFSIPGKIIIAESLGFAVRLFNRSTFGVLETRDIPKEIVRTLLNITAGYTAPLLVDNYLAGNITAVAVGSSLNSLIEKEDLVVSRAEASNLTSRSFSPKAGLPLVKVNVVLVYSPYTHFVTIFVRGVGEGCSGNRLFVLQYEVDKNGLLVKDTLKQRPVINLETRSSVVDVTDSATLVQQKYRINSELGNLPTELCTKTEAVPGYKYPLCYIRHWRPWIADLLRKTAGHYYVALLADTQTQAPAELSLEFPNQRKYVVFSGCRSHSCPWAYAYFLVDPVKREIEIIWIREDVGTRFIGPNAEILRRTNAFGWLQYDGYSLRGAER